MKIRPVNGNDHEEWLRMRMALWPDSSPGKEAQEIGRFLAGHRLPELEAAFVCERSNGGLCGLVEVSVHPSAPGCETKRIGYLEAWYVDPGFRRQGVGKALAVVAEDWARAEGCLEMASDTNPSYPLSPAAHQASGYEEVARHFCKKLEEQASG